MNPRHLAITGTGLVTSVGQTAAQSCAAFRAKISNPTETRFIGSGGEWIMAHQVELAQPWRGLTKLAKMAALAIEEALQDLPRPQWSSVPLLLCVAEAERPGRMDGLDDRLFPQIQEELGARFAADSAIVTQGRVGVAVALLQARKLIAEGGHARVLIAATDSLLTWPTLGHYEREGRLLTERNSNGFMPGEGAGALLIEPARGQAGELVCSGIGFGREAAHIDSGEPLRADGLTAAFKLALAEADCSMHEINCRVSTASGEQYFFKEASLAFDRVLRVRAVGTEHWHPAESMGETGAAAGLATAMLAYSACTRSFAPGSHFVLHASNDASQRTAVILRRNQ
jgi:3-oxoacyl-[acyl-carrier-protein] synthase-1